MNEAGEEMKNLDVDMKEYPTIWPLFSGVMSGVVSRTGAAPRRRTRTNSCTLLITVFPHKYKHTAVQSSEQQSEFVLFSACFLFSRFLSASPKR